MVGRKDVDKQVRNHIKGLLKPLEELTNELEF